MRGVNKAIILGNVGNDPEIRNTSSGLCVASLSIATSESWTDKQSGEKQERTEWHRVTAFGRTAEIVSEYVTKGSKLYIEGKLQTEKYTDKEGVERYTTKIIVENLQLLGDRPQGGSAAGGNRSTSSGASGNGARGSSGNNRAQERSTRLDQRPYGSGGQQAGNSSFDDDDIPF